MKKLFSLLLVITMILSLCACGINNEQHVVSNSKKTLEAEQPKQGDIRNVVEFDSEKIIFEDTNVKVVLLSFSEEYANYDVDPRYQGVISYKVYNKTNETLYVGMEEGYIRNEKVVLYLSGATVQGGKSAIVQQETDKETPNGAVAKSYSSEDLYQLSGSFRVMDEDSDSIYYEVPFDFSDIL